MPFRSEAQRRFLFARHPDIAKRWAAEYGTPKNLPKHVKTGSKSPAAGRPKSRKRRAMERLAKLRRKH